MAIDIAGVTNFFPGYKTQWGIEGYLFTAQANDLEHSRKADKIDGSGFGTRVRNNLPGMQDGTLKIKGLAVMDEQQISWQLGQWFGRTAPVNAWFALQGLGIGSPVTMQPSSVIDTSVSAKLKDAVSFTLELDARGAYNDGFILLSPQTLLTGASGTGPQQNDTVAYGGATVTGGAGQLHVLALDGGTNPTVTVNIQHSPDGVTWTTLLTFPAQGVGSKRVVLSSTTTVNPYLQTTWTATGSPTDVQVLCGFSRGLNPNA